jgi:serine/threonine protein kinase
MTESSLDLESLVHHRVGTVVVGKYTLDRVIGIGGMAAVYAATHRNQAEFAVKMLHPDVSSREDIRSRFLREGYIANSVKHPGAVRVVDDDVAEDGAAFLVMELLDGATVEDLWFRGDRRVPLRAALAIAHQLLDVLAAAHSKNIVHRDIKPANLFVSHTGDLKVLDFGIARLRDATMNAITQAGAMLGTPAFMAPEQARGLSKEVDGQTDVWAVGATLFALLTGRLVHEADSATMLLLRVATTPARSLGTVAKDVPAPVVALVDRALAFEKSSRWESAAAMRDALAEAYVATYDEPLSRDVLAAYFRAMEEAPAHAKRESPAPGDSDDDDDRPREPDTTSLVSTKVEGKGAPKVAEAPPVEPERPSVSPESSVAASSLPPPSPRLSEAPPFSPPTRISEVSPLVNATRVSPVPPFSPPARLSPVPPFSPPTRISAVPPAPAAPPATSTDLTKSQPSATVPPPTLRGATTPARTRSLVPFLVGAALIVLGLLLGIAAMFRGGPRPGP